VNGREKGDLVDGGGKTGDGKGERRQEVMGTNQEQNLQKRGENGNMTSVPQLRGLTSYGDTGRGGHKRGVERDRLRY